MIVLALLSGLVAVAAVLFILAGHAVPVQAASNAGSVNAPAAEIHVCPSGCIYSSVQAAVDAANAGDVIKVAAGDYTDIHSRTVPAGYPNPPVSGYITQVIYISKTVTVRGGYTTTNWTTPDPETNHTTLDAQGQGRVVVIAGDITPTVEGLRITGGNATGLGGDPWVDDDVGGGVYLQCSDVTLRGNTITSNTAHHGGGLCVNGSGAMLYDNTVSSNIAGSAGGGLFIFGSDATLIDNTISTNTSGFSGGGAYLDRSNVTLDGNAIHNNTGGASGGGLLLYLNDATFSNNTVTANDANYEGGGLCILVSNATVSGNTASPPTLPVGAAAGST